MWRGSGAFLAASTVMALAAAPLSAMDLPRKSPPLSIEMNGGKPLQIQSYKGKVVLLAFILTTCPHCQHTTAILKQLQTEYGPRGLQVVEAAIDQGAEAMVPGFLMRFGPNFPVGFTTYDKAAEYLQHNPNLILHVPALVFIDRQGIIRAEYEGDDRFFADDVQDKNLCDQIEKLLHSPQTGKTQTAKRAGRN